MRAHAPRRPGGRAERDAASELAIERRVHELLDAGDCDWVEAWARARAGQELVEAEADEAIAPGRSSVAGQLGSRPRARRGAGVPGRLNRTTGMRPSAVAAGATAGLAVMRSAVRPEVDADASELIDRARRGGAGLDATLRPALEAALGASLAAVRVHVGAEVDAAADALGARAFAIGDDVFFRDGAYDPSSRDGQRLIAHEVAHTVQARGASPATGPMTVSEPGDAGEHEADAFADAFVLGLHGVTPPPRAAAPRPMVPPVQARAVDAPAIARTPATSGAQAAPGRAPSPAHEDAILRRPVPVTVNATMDGLSFHPVHGAARWEPGMLLLDQYMAAVLRCLVGRAYTVALLRATLASGYFLVGDSDRNEYVPREGRAVTPFRCPTAAAMQLVAELERRGLAVSLTAEQRRVLGASASADLAFGLARSAMSVGGADQSLPGWYDDRLFRHQMAQHITLLDRFVAARAALQHAGPDADETPLLEVEAEIRDVLGAPARGIEAIRLDGELTDHPMYRRLWNLPAAPTSGRGAEPAPVADEGATIDHGLATQLLAIFASADVRVRVLADGAAGHQAREQILDDLGGLERARQETPRAPGDARLGDAAARATLPPVPSRLSAYPALAPPANRVTSGTSRHFTMSLDFVDDLEAMAAHFRTVYEWELIRVPDAQPATAQAVADDPDRRSEPLGVAALVRQRLRRQAEYARADALRVTQLSGPLGLPNVGALTVVAASRMAASLGTVVRTFLQPVDAPQSGLEIPLDDPGLYVVRSKATVLPPSEGLPLWVRAPSVAWMPVLATSARLMAELSSSRELELRDGNLARLAEIEDELATRGLDDDRRQQLLEERRVLEILVDGSLDTVLTLESQQLARLSADLWTERAARVQAGQATDDLDVERARIRAREAELAQLLDRHAERLIEHGASASLGLEAPFRLIATLVGDQGEIPLALEVIQQPSAPATWRYYVSDLTTPDSGDAEGPALPSRIAAIRQAVKVLLEGPNRYGRGHCSILIPPPGGARGQRWPETFAVDAAPATIALEAVENIAGVLGIALTAAAMFIGAAPLAFMVPIGIVGSIPAAYRLVQRGSSGTLRVDLSSAMDIVDIVGSLAGLGQMASGARWARVGGGCMILGMGTDGLGAALASAQFIQQVRSIDPEAPAGVRHAMLMELVGNQLLSLGMRIGGELVGRAQLARAQAAQGAPDLLLPRASVALQDRFRALIGAHAGNVELYAQGATGPTGDATTTIPSVDIQVRLDGYGLVRDIHVVIQGDPGAVDLAPVAERVRAMQRIEVVEGQVRGQLDRYHHLIRRLADRPDEAGAGADASAADASAPIEAMPARLRELLEQARTGELDEAGIDRQLEAIRRDLTAQTRALDARADSNAVPASADDVTVAVPDPAEPLAARNRRSDEDAATTEAAPELESTTTEEPAADGPVHGPQVLTARERLAYEHWQRLTTDPDRRYRPRRMTREQFVALYADNFELSADSRRWRRVGGGAVEPEYTFRAGATDETVLARLRRGSFGPFERMVRRLGLPETDEDSVRQRLNALGFLGRTEGTVRHQLKTTWRGHLMDRLCGVTLDGDAVPDHRALMEQRYPELDWSGSPEATYEAARHIDFLRETDALNPSDKGNLYELFSRRVHRGGAMPHARILRDEIGGDGSDRIPDNMHTTPNHPGYFTLQEYKNVVGLLSAHAMGQIRDYRVLGGYTVNTVTGANRQDVFINAVLVTLADPRGVWANRGNVRTLLDEDRHGLMAFEIYNWRGERTSIPGPRLGADFTDADLQAFIGTAPDWARRRGGSRPP